MKYFTKLFWISLLVFTANQFLEKAGVFIPYIHSYLDDVLCPPIVLGFTLSFQQQVTYRSPGYVFNYWYVVLFVVWYFLLFEWIFPSFDSRHHSDLYDLIAYTAGGLLFYWKGNKPAPALLQGRVLSRRS